MSTMIKKKIELQKQRISEQIRTIKEHTVTEQSEVLKERLEKSLNNLKPIVAELENNLSETDELYFENLQSFLIDGEETRDELQAKLSFIMKERERNFQEKLALQKLENEKEIEINRIQNNQTAAENIVHLSSTPRTVKLPKLELRKFDGAILNWYEFWDSFNVTIHSNKTLNPVDKFNYLRGCLEGKAKELIDGLQLTNRNYEIAVNLLEENFGSNERIVQSLYMELMNLPSSTNDSASLRNTYNNVEKILRSLEAMGELVDNSQMVSTIRSKFTKEIILKLEESNTNREQWTARKLRSAINNLIVAQEVTNQLFPKPHYFPKLESHRTYKPVEVTKQLFPSAYKPVQSTNNSGMLNVKSPTCIYCNANHWSDECRRYDTIEKRKAKLKGHCFICLKANHNLNQCVSEKACIYCKQKYNHHRSLCPNKFSSHREIVKLVSEKSSTENSSTEDLSTEISALAINEEVLMQTAQVEVKNDVESLGVRSRIFLDCGSQRSYITTAMCEKLNLKPMYYQKLSLMTFGSTVAKEIETPVVNVKLKLKNEEKPLEIKCNVVPNVSGKIVRMPISQANIKLETMNYILADSFPEKEERSDINLLIGNDYYWDFILPEKVQLSCGLYMINSKFGWILTGKYESSISNPRTETLFVNTRQEPLQFDVFNDPIEKFDIERMWCLDTIGIKDSPKVNDDAKAIEQFNKTVKFVDGRYNVTWPWKNEDDNLPTNYDLARGRLKSLVKKLKAESLINKYNDVIMSQLEVGVIEKVEDQHSSYEHKTHYIPHHGVLTENKETTKLRIVYDASAKTKKEYNSLNESLFRGPVFLENICGLLCRFRTHQIGIIADIEKAFLQVGLQDKERDVTRFLWLKNPEIPLNDENIQVYRFTRIPFGVISSPFLLGATINYHLQQDGSDIANNIRYNLYVDNVVTGTSSVENAKVYYNTSKEIFNSASMNLRQWSTNSEEFRNCIPKKDLTVEKPILVLGLIWDTDSDTLSIKESKLPKECDYQKNTKRSILKSLAKVFDPLGYFSPILLKGKQILQRCWENHLNWDDTLDNETMNEWKSVTDSIDKISTIKLPRYLECDQSEDTKFSLMCFCDASSQAYATIIYLHVEKRECRNTHLIFSKTRLAPKRIVSIPRLELLAVNIGIRSLKFIEAELKLPIIQKTLWTDSQCVLHWLKTNKTLPIFVENRVKEIRTCKDIDFLYISTDENPADIASRGATFTMLMNSNWFEGPIWINDQKENWPQWKINSSDDTTISVNHEECLAASNELKTQKSQNTVFDYPFYINPNDFSTLIRLIRVTAWCLRFIKNVKGKCGSRDDILSCEELKEAKTLWEIRSQSIYYPEVMEDKSNKLKKQLDLKVDENGVIRCYGRLIHADLPKEALFPKLLHQKDPFTRLVVEDFHNCALHAGTSTTLSQLRREYWIPKGRKTVQTILNRCIVCVKSEGGSYKIPDAPPLPKSRVTVGYAFGYTGVDYFGPITIKFGKRSEKAWIVIFACETTRALHLELVENLSTVEFIQCLKRFIARRGKPIEFKSDNASQFKLAKTVINNAWYQLLNDTSVQNYIANVGIRWNFIIEEAPWMGGFYERLIKEIKRSLNKTVGKRILTWSQMNTLVVEIEAVLNSRPLTYVDQDISSFVLTPAHFLSINQKTGMPDIVDHNIDLLATWKRGTEYLNEFWNVWKNHYLVSLRERMIKVNKFNKTSMRVPKIDDVVIIKEKLLPRGTWRLGKLVEINISNDGKHRSAKVLLSGNVVVQRPLNKLFPLEV